MASDVSNYFFDRKEQLELLKRRVLNLKEGYRQNIAFLGDRYIGKSSIIQKFLLDLDDPDIVPIYVDLENKDFQYFASKFIGSILFHFAKSKNLPLHEDLNLLIEQTRKLIPRTGEEIKKILAALAKAKTTEAYRDLMNLP